MIEQLLNKIKKILNNSLEIEVETYEGLKASIIVRAGASEEEINKCNSYFANNLPVDYLSFLRNYNGCTFFKVSNLAGFQFWGCDQLVHENKFQKENFGLDWDERIILICACLGDGDYIGIKLNEDRSYEIVDAFGEEIPANWNSIGSSFSEFLENLIEEKGKKFWL